MSSSKASSEVFRAIAHARHSCRRFNEKKNIPQNVLKDIVETTLVRRFNITIDGAESFK